MAKLLRLAPYATLLLLAGCGDRTSTPVVAASPATTPSATPAPAATSPADPVTATTPPKGEATAPTPAAKPAEATKVEPAKQPDAPKPAATASKVPAPLQHDGYAYYGLESDKLFTYSFTQGGASTEATRQFEFTGIKNGKPQYIAHQGGAFASQGDITLSLEPGGVYVLGSTKSKVSPHTLEIPSKLAPGISWKDHTEVETNGVKLRIDNVFKATGIEKVTTKSGTFDALVLVGTGSGLQNGKKVKMETKQWWVKGHGAVKQTVKLQPDSGPAQELTVEEVKG